MISFVSSGPGAGDLLTLRAARRLREAEVVLYDDLSSGPVLDHAGPDALLIAVGKRAGRPSARQEDVNAALIDHARRFTRVVRLKSGDCTLFGRLEEEITAIRAAGLDYEVVPGVTAATAAAAAAGMPLSRRLTARRVQFVTGADVTGGLPGNVNWAALADASAVTVVYMGQRTFPRLVAGLIAAGMPPETPAMRAEAIGLAEQQIARTTLSDLAKTLAQAVSDQPVLILYGALADGGAADHGQGLAPSTACTDMAGGNAAGGKAARDGGTGDGGTGDDGNGGNAAGSDATGDSGTSDRGTRDRATSRKGIGGKGLDSEGSGGNGTTSSGAPA